LWSLGSIFSKQYMKQKLSRLRQGFTLVELLIVITIIGLLASLAIPSMTQALTRAYLLQAVNNGQEVYKAVLQASNDAATNGNYAVGWPGDMTNPPIDMVSYVTALSSGGYLPNLKVLIATGIPVAGTTPTPKNIAFSFGMVTSSTADNVPFLTTKNFNPSNIKPIDPNAPATTQATTDTPAAPTDGSTATTGDQAAAQPVGALDPTAKPFGKKGFAVVRKGGDATSYTNPNDPYTPQGGPGSYVWGVDPSTVTPPIKWIQTPQE
jgi:prepilin-type N-terminal cleavage/methylation domain-containing protein